MIRDIFENIEQNRDLRQNLIELKTQLKEESNRIALLYYLSGDYTIFDTLLRNEDAKVRKNTALIMGTLSVPVFLDKLFESYKKEEQLFVKSSYLDAIKDMDYLKILPELKLRLDELSHMEITEKDKKHINEEMKSLSELIIATEGINKHQFTGYHVPSQIILLTNRNFISVTKNQLKTLKTKEFNAGVIINTDELRDILSIRTYNELLFMFNDMKECNMSVEGVANTISNGGMIQFMKARHNGSAPYYFRIELKSKMDLDKKSTFTKKLAAEIERLTNRKLINSTSNYEVEIRLIENKTGNFNILIKLYTLIDDRFSYRKNVIPSSIHPVNAALITELSKEYLKEDAQVLDPFCGVGTMLIERNKLVKAGSMYGLDIFGEAIEKAKVNTKEAHAIVHYINRNFFDFKHEYLFDEIITNMPSAMGNKDANEVFSLYQRFFIKAQEHLKKDGVLILYSHNRDFVRKLMNKKIYYLEQEYEISKKEGVYLFIIRYIG